MGLSTRYRGWLLLSIATLGLEATAKAQVQVGSDVQLNLNGSLAAGYSASYGDNFPSGHGFTYGGTADLSGSYYDPKFLSFHVNPYLNQSRENSNFQSITSASGVNAGAAIFGGSEYPGWVNFSQTFNGSGTYAVPGLPNYVANGDARTFGVGWSELKPNWPLATVTYQQGTSDYSVFGTNSTSNVHYKSFGANVSDIVAGFHLNGNYQHGDSHADYPQLISPLYPSKFDSNNSTFAFTGSHSIPWKGNASATFTHSDYAYDSGLSNGSGGINSVEANAGVNPSPKLTLDANMYYTDNLIGTLYQRILGAGGAVISTPGSSSSSFSFSGSAVYTINDRWRVIGRGDHRVQTYDTGSYASNSFGGVVSYVNVLRGGVFNFTQNVMETVFNYNGQSQLGLTTAIGYSRSFGPWNTSGNFNFFENQQTLLVMYQNSGYGYSATLGRKVGYKSYWSLGASGAKSLYNNQSGWGYYNQNYTMSLTSHKIGASANYNKSNGNGLLAGSGVVPTPLPGPIIPVPELVYAGESYSFGVGGQPVRRLTFSGSYTRYKSSTSAPSQYSNNTGELATFYMQYAFRRLYFNAGYTRIFQGFSGTGVPPASANSYYAGISRWFNFF